MGQNREMQECLNSNGQAVLKFSTQFANQIESIQQRGYELKRAKVNFIVYWQKEGAENEAKIILPELYFEKQQNEDYKKEGKSSM